MATATSKLQIILDVLGDKKVQSAMTQIGIAVAGAAVAAVAAKKAWDFTKEGAALQLTATQFNNVATAAGYMSDTLLGKMRDATNGLVTDAELMRSGLQIIELGLADSEQGVVDLATVVSTLGLDMQQVIMTFANDSIMRLDALGLSVEEVTNRQKELNAEGFDGDAFDQAVLEGLQKRMEVLGDTAETTAGQMQMLETDIVNLLDSAKKSAAEGIGPFVSKVVDAQDAVEIMHDMVGKGVFTMSEYLKMWVLLRNPLGDHEAILAGLVETQEEYYNEIQATALAQDYVNNIMNRGAEIIERTTSLHYAGRTAYSEMSKAVRAGGEYIYKAAEAQGELNEQVTIAGQAYSKLAVGIGNATEANRKRIEYLTSGGGALNLLAEKVQEAIDAGEWDIAGKWNDELTKADIDFKLEADDIDVDEAAARLVEELGVTPAEADEIVEELERTLFEFTAITRMLKFGIAIDYSNLPPGVSPPDIQWDGDTGVEPGVPGTGLPSLPSPYPAPSPGASNPLPPGNNTPTMVINITGGNPEEIANQVINELKYRMN